MSAAPNHPLQALEQTLAAFTAPGALVRAGGSVVEVSASHYRLRGLARNARIGDVVEHRSHGTTRTAEVVRVEEGGVSVSPYETTVDLGIGAEFYNLGPLRIQPDDSWRGRVVDALGRPIDGGEALAPSQAIPKAAAPPLARQRGGTPFQTGVRVVDMFTPLCFGQRIGVFAGSGVGKSTLLAMLAAAEAFDTVVVALVGERSREVREFLEDTIGPEHRAKTLAVVSTSDESAMMRRRAPSTAMAAAEHFRDQGHRVLLIVDSITRFAHALREVASASGEPPVARGYPASVFTEMPKLLERAGPGREGETGSITAIISVLVDGDDHNDPISDSVRGILDGHVVLSRSIAEQGRLPAVDPLTSVSRLANRAWTDEQRILVQRLRLMIARYEDTRDIRLLGAYQAGADLDLDVAIRQVPHIYEALTQAPSDPASGDPFGDLARHLKASEARHGQS